MSRPDLRASRIALAMAIGGTVALAACVPPAPEPTPAPTSTPEPQPTAPIVAELPTPTYDNWMDAPQTPGDWRYSRPAGGGSTQASFGQTSGATRLTMTCDFASHQVRLARPAANANGPAQMRLRAESTDRTVQAQPENGALVVGLPASDPLLDAIAFSKGRFALETAGQETLYVPAYPEISRVIEDCRRGAL